MRLVELRVENFRSIGEAQSIKLRSSHAVLVGPNNAGKTNLLTALEWVLHTWPNRLNAQAHDYFDPKQSISITATIGDADEDDTKALYPATSSKEQRGSLAKKDDPRVIIQLTVSPFESDDLADDDLGRARLELDLWGFGIRQRVGNRRAAVVRFMGVPSARKISDDVAAAKWGPYRDLVRATLVESPEYADLERRLQELNDGVGRAFAERKERVLEDARVVSYVEDIQFRLTQDGDPVELLRNLELLVTDHGKTLPLERLGTGTQSVVVIAMLEIALRARAGALRVLTVEEPDAFLHPHGTRHVASLIKRIASEPRSQVLLTTHSPSLLATLVPGEIVRVARRATGTAVVQTEDAVQPREFARRINQDTAEMFFAQRVVLVEGDTERFLLPALSGLVRREGKSLDFAHLGVSVISVGGKTGVVPYLRLLDDFKIERMVILDNDFLDGPECPRLIKYLQERGDQIDGPDRESLRRGLYKHHVSVLSRGEIEDYVPIADVAALTNRSEADVEAAVSTAGKTSRAFVSLFDSGKPQYAQILAAHYHEAGEVPAELDRILRWIAESVQLPQ